ncbi:hypothetical protein Tco_0765075 [Tanacetum coccineum]
MENVNSSSSTSNSEFLDPKKKIEIKSWLKDNRIVDSLVGSDEIKYFDTFPTLEELEYHEWLEEGTVTFEKDNEKITFKMPHKMKAFNHIEFKDVNTDSIPPFVLENNDVCGKTYSLDSLTLGPEYREDESIILSSDLTYKIACKKFIIKNKEEIFTDAGDGARIIPDGVAPPTM